MMRIPHKLTNMNMFLDGVGFAGLVTEITLPVIKFKSEDHQGGGMDAPISIEMGMEPLEASFVLSSYETEVFAAAGFQENVSTGIICRGALKKDDEVIPLNVVLRGRIEEIDFGTWKPGDESSMKFTLKVDFYQLMKGVVELCYIDIKSSIRRIGGKDQLDAVRAALLL